MQPQDSLKARHKIILLQESWLLPLRSDMLCQRGVLRVTVCGSEASLSV